MPAASDLNVPQILKTVWENDIADFTYTNMPLLAMMPKATDWDGQYTDITIKYGGMGGRSAGFGAAKKNRGPSKFAKMHISTSDNFQLWDVDHKLITLSRNNRGALVRALTDQTEHALKRFKRSVGFMLYKNGGGAIGQISALGASSLTLVNINDARNYESGDVIELATTDGTTGATKPGVLEILSVDEDLGVLTFTTTVAAGIPTAAVSDYVFIEGDFGKALYGVDAYVPKFAPGTNGVPLNIWGMDRSPHLQRLGGIRVSGAGLLIVEAIKYGLTTAFKRSADTTHLFMNPDNFNDLDSSLGSARRYADSKVGNVGFTGIQFTAHGSAPVECYSDPDCPPNVVYGLSMPTWKLHSADDFPMWLSLDGKKTFFVEENANASEGRLGGYAQVYTTAPGENFRLALATGA